ncbi:DcaP family trimeric outer membrane transporter [Carboxylicivirga marina]|uniref:DcaP family trimeric outer membrane transporter n=1 Tax=Carboxylicivirga marina TaxID=2800988 RepID=UPI0025923343|nr:DcaP family trimeric outer membrane transporter [uncultured Carboxylicivirga sp.]
MRLIFNMKALISLTILLLNFSLNAQEQNASFRIYGHAMADMGYNFNQIHPDWTDVVRPSQLPSYDGQYNPDGNVFYGVRQTRLGVESIVPNDLGDLKIIFEFELFGTGVDAGQTTFRLRHAYGELGQFGAGQYWSPFMDIDVFPNTIEYWGPTGMVFFRNIQFRWMPIKGDTRLTFALERPGASADGGVYQQNGYWDEVHGRFPLPDFSAEYRQAFNWGYLELATMLRYIEWDDLNDNDNIDLTDSAMGWGLNLSSNVHFTKSTVGRFQVMYGEAVQNYMNDGGIDIGIENNPDDPSMPIKGAAQPVLGIVAFIDHRWNEQFSSSAGFSMLDIDHANAQVPDSYAQGQYALANLLYYPVKNVMAGVELQYGKRKNFSDGFTSDIVKVQFSFKYSFSSK